MFAQRLPCCFYSFIPVHGCRRCWLLSLGLYVIRAERKKCSGSVMCRNCALNNRCIVFKCVCVCVCSGRKKDLAVSARCYKMCPCRSAGGSSVALCAPAALRLVRFKVWSLTQPGMCCCELVCVRTHAGKKSHRVLERDTRSLPQHRFFGDNSSLLFSVCANTGWMDARLMCGLQVRDKSLR